MRRSIRNPYQQQADRSQWLTLLGMAIILSCAACCKRFFPAEPEKTTPVVQLSSIIQG
ncbi:hypothetical protein [Hymenobacter sp. YC55]|uniref:hypothetical protein n=1 Tax=Hymenobacter sp. YC55 TaxID=3034019 RepID=UPI0023F87979|nr:hypothetical protein [Hymenobacter sp. YC55]MDF7810481.1 hypothetical protein [Hymenobacter sp. YC55]